MTRKDYEQLAEALREVHPERPLKMFTTPKAQHVRDCQAIADVLAQNSRGFDRELFLRNCGVKL